MELMTVPEAAGLLKLSQSYVYALCQRRIIPTITLGRSVRIPRGELEAWLRRQMHLTEHRPNVILVTGAVPVAERDPLDVEPRTAPAVKMDDGRLRGLPNRK